MIKRSIRIFSVEEIYEIVEKREYSSEFLEYMNNAPDNIKEWLKKLGVDESLFVTVKAEKSTSDISESSTAATVPDDLQTTGVTEQPDLDLTAQEQPDLDLTAQEQPDLDPTAQEQPDLVPTAQEEPEPLDDEELYSDMRFGDKIRVGRLVIHEMTGTKCSVHFKPYQRIKVVCAVGTKSFSVRTYCCPQCCKLFMKEGNYKGIEPILQKRGVDYVWIPASEGTK